jgi:signal transduction histidine kinase
MPAVALLSALLIGGVFLADVLTPQALVVAILYNVPIALTGLALSRRLTLGMTLLALAANLVAGVLNAQATGGFESVAVFNRTFAGLSFLLVALLSLQAGKSSSRLALARAEERRARRERQLRQLVEDLSGPLTPSELLERTARVLKNLFEADAAAVMTLRSGRWGERLYASPKGWETPGEAPASSPQPVRQVLLSGRSFLLGQLQPDLLLLFEHPRHEGAAAFLLELLPPLQALWGKARLFARLQEQQAEVAQRNAVIRDLIYAFSHDLRTPLMANAMNLRLALEGAYGELSEEFKRSLRNGLEANQDLLELAEELLLVAQLESGETLPPKRPVDLARLVREGVERLEGLWRERGLRVSVKAPKRLEIMGREGDLRRLLQNLLDNAAKFAPPGSDVEVGLEEVGGVARLEVADRGPGVPPEARERLFTRFASHRAGGGKGLGLYLARQIAESHGGSIRYQERPGGGSLFRIELPLSTPSPPQESFEASSV